MDLNNNIMEFSLIFFIVIYCIIRFIKALDKPISPQNTVFERPEPAGEAPTKRPNQSKMYGDSFTVNIEAPTRGRPPNPKGQGGSNIN